MMRQRIMRVSLVSILVFGLLLGGQIIYRNTYTNGQLNKNGRQIPGVVSAELISENGQKVLEVTTNHIEDFEKAGQQLETLAGEHPIRIKDQRTPELEKLMSQMQFSLQEGIVRGNFTQMEEMLQQLASQAGVTLELSMDSEGIYVNLTQGQAQLLEVVERPGQGKYLQSEGQ
ncbi:hypothetical protein [Desulfitobacterium sp.]|uniref:Uncharacterized protein n=1 Tax=bioreactor metagenome TaxID=1076179 RepID=A0A645DU09_9ZZZZ|nr:hypothetical protein [Desulfitobacterium sp.]MEA4901262.1 hypothetical protein [Desulfitobacterium sp.]